jgi:hypothetical protein
MGPKPSKSKQAEAEKAAAAAKVSAARKDANNPKTYSTTVVKREFGGK